MSKKKYKDLFIDFDDTLYDTHGNAIIALKELYEVMNLREKLFSEEKFYASYWKANIDLWGQYGRGEIDRDYLIVERFRRPLDETAYDSAGWLTKDYCLEVSDRFLELCSDKPGVVEGAHELMYHLKSKGYRLHICSNGFHEVQYKKLHASGLFKNFDTIILSEDAGANKPSRAFFDYAFSQTKAIPETTLMILHQPFCDRYSGYRALEEAYKAGKVRAIGVSNHFADHFIDLANNVEIPPMVNQMETHVLHIKDKL